MEDDDDEVPAAPVLAYIHEQSAFACDLWGIFDRLLCHHSGAEDLAVRLVKSAAGLGMDIGVHCDIVSVAEVRFEVHF